MVFKDFITEFYRPLVEKNCVMCLNLYMMQRSWREITTVIASARYLTELQKRQVSIALWKCSEQICVRVRYLSRVRLSIFLLYRVWFWQFGFISDMGHFEFAFRQNLIFVFSLVYQVSQSFLSFFFWAILLGSTCICACSDVIEIWWSRNLTLWLQWSICLKW